MNNAAIDLRADGLPTVLLVEDSVDDVLLVRRALNKAGLAVRLEVAADGDAALACLGADTSDRERLAPDLILLDLKLPRRSGLDVLRWIRSRAELAATPVVVLTSSAEHEDIQGAYAAGANSYLQKPVAFQGLVQLLTALDLYWFRHNLTAPPFPAPHSHDRSTT